MSSVGRFAGQCRREKGGPITGMVADKIIFIAEEDRHHVTPGDSGWPTNGE